MNELDFKLEDFQFPGYNKLVTSKRHLLLYRPGLGKTVVATKAAYDIEARCILIVCPRNAIRTWEDHIKTWWDGLDVASGKTTEETETSFHIWRWRKKYNNADARKKLWRSKDTGAKVNVYITTFGSFLRDQEHFIQNYDVLIVDEAKRIRSRKAKAFIALKPIAKAAKYVWLLTGTPGYWPPHFWAYLHLLDHKYFSSYWKFVGAFMYTQKNSWGGFEILGLKNQVAWITYLKQYASILTKEDVGHRPTIRQFLWAELDQDQERLYKEMQDDMMMVTEGQILLASTAMTQVLRYRQLLVCPKIIDSSLSIGGAFADFVEEMKDGEINPHTVVFCPFTQAFPHFEAYLKANGFSNVFTLQGGMDPDELIATIEAWRKTNGIILVSIMFAQSFSLEPASECYFFGREFDPDDNEQAEERLNRLTTKYQVNAYYYAYEETYDVDQKLILDNKTRWSNATLGRKK